MMKMFSITQFSVAISYKIRRLIFLIFFTILLIGNKSALAQEQPVKIDTLDFARFDADTFYFSQDTSLLVNFYRKLDSVIQFKQGNVNIIHIGGSHVQAGVMSHRIRQHLLTTYPESVASRGFIFPYSVAPKSNNPIDYRVIHQGSFGLVRNVYKELEKPLGVAGIGAYSRDTFAEIKIEIKNSYPLFVTDSIVLFGFADSGLVVPEIVLDSIPYMPVFVDTLLQRYIYKVPPFSDSFAVRWRVDTGNCFTLSGIWLGNNAPGITFHSIGVNGASVSSFLSCVNFERDLTFLKPDMVIFGIGINDAASEKFDTLEFEKNYLLLIDKIKSVNPECAFVFITNNDSYKRIARGKYSVNTNGIAARNVFYRLAAQTSGAVWDQFEIMGGLKSMYKWMQAGLAKKDRVHFTNAGYNLMGDLFFNAWLDAKRKVNLENKDVLLINE